LYIACAQIKLEKTTQEVEALREIIPALRCTKENLRKEEASLKRQNQDLADDLAQVRLRG
jgi:cell division protein FtsB